jgi:hypothetical protein
VKALSCMRDDFDPRPQFWTNIILKNKLKVILCFRSDLMLTVAIPCNWQIMVLPYLLIKGCPCYYI